VIEQDMKASIEVTGIQMVQGGARAAAVVERTLEALVSGGGSVTQERAWGRDATRFILEGTPELVNRATTALMAFIGETEQQ
jgi:hypothetical protein